MNAYVSKEELSLLSTNRISHPEHYADAGNQRQSVFAAVTGRIATFFERRRVLGELNSLSDRELADIGLSRQDLRLVFSPTFTSRS